MWPPFRGLPTARWRWPPLAPSSARHPRSATSASSRCCCSTRRPRSTPSPRSRSPGVVNSWWRPTEDGEHVRRASPRSCTPSRTTDQPPAHDMAALLAAHPRRMEGAEMRRRFDERGIQYGPAFTGLTAARTAEGAGNHRAGRGRAARLDPLTAGRVMACTRRCWMPASSPSRPTPASKRGLRRSAVAAGCSSAACLQLRPQRPLLLLAGDRGRHQRGRGRPRRLGRARRQSC